MNKVLILFFLTLIGTNQNIVADENIYTDTNIAIKMIEKSNIQFISVEENEKDIRGSKLLELKLLSFTHILGKQRCAPLYSCPKKIENFFSAMGISKNQPLVIYDNSYGIYAATLYTLLESLGHQNMTILNGGIEAIKELDPNQKSYSKYKLTLENLIKDNNISSIKNIDSKLNDLRNKLKVLEPHLLIQKHVELKEKLEKTNYKVSNINATYLLSKNDLKESVKSVRLSHKESNLTIVDVCPMVDIVGNSMGTYIPGVKSLSWKYVIDKKTKQLKPEKELEQLFEESGFDKNNDHHLYCMSGSPKALFMMTVMRQVGYDKVKAFTGDWNVWIGDINE